MPFTVITLKRVPQSLRGDLTKWMQEISEGVYVGNFNSRIREELWKRVLENVEQGEATISYACRNEIGYKFETWNTNRQIIDLEGIPLVLIPKQQCITMGKRKLGFSNAYKFHQGRKYSGRKSTESNDFKPYVVIDIETDGLDYRENRVIEIGAIKVKEGRQDTFSYVIEHDKMLPSKIVNLTGITNELLQSEGKPIKEVLLKLIEFIGDYVLVGYNVSFDIGFLNNALKTNNLQALNNKNIDLKTLVKQEKMFLRNYKLETALQAYGIDQEIRHRALEDAKLTYLLSTKVKAFSKNLK